MIKVCLSHDIDRIDKTYQYLTKPLRVLKRGDVGLTFKCLWRMIFDRNPYWGFNHIIEIENYYEVKSTCFFLDESIRFNFLKPQTWVLSLGRYKINNKKIHQIMRFLDKNGWEIGVHGSYNSYNDLDLLKKEKHNIERILGHKVVGVRQHYLNFSEKTNQIQKQAGFSYDSTWGYTKDIGFKDNRITPFFPVTCAQFCEIPLVIMDYPFVEMVDKWERFEQLCNICEENESYMVINFHNNNYYELDFPNVKSDYIEIIERLKNKGADFLTLQQAYNQITNP